MISMRMAVSAILGLGALAASAVEDQPMPPRDASMFLVSPLAGWNRNELTVPAQGPMPATTLTDEAMEYGLMAMYVSPRFVANNMLFFTRVNDSDVWGNIAFLNVYGDPKSVCTWNVGAGYVWHEIDSDKNKTRISEPMAKAGPMLRIRPLHLIVNPYVGFAWEDVKTTHGNSQTESVLYGVAVSWYWRMLQANVRYYLRDDLDRDERFNVVRTWASCMLNRRFGLIGRFEYMEQTTSKDTSALFGPVVVF